MTGDTRHENRTSPKPGRLDAHREQTQPLLVSPAPTEVFRDAVHGAKIVVDENIPHLSASLIDKYVDDLKHLGLLANHERRSA